MRAWSGSLKAVSAFALSGALLTGAAAATYAQATQTMAVTLDGTQRPFVISGTPSTIRAGVPITINARNVGPAGDSSGPNTHNVAIDGNGVDWKAPNPNLIGGQTATIQVPALQPGTYTLYCPVGAHRANGMQTTLTVVAGAAALPATGGLAGTPVLPLGLAGAGIAAGAAGVILRRRGAKQ